MAEHDPLLTLRQMAQFAEEAARIGEEGDRGRLEKDRTYLRAAERVVELIGESAARLPAELRARQEEIPWRAIIAMRNRLIHGYDGVDYEILWDVLSNRAPELARRLPAIIEQEQKGTGR